MSLSDDQLDAMEASAPLLVQEVRNLRGELHKTIGENADIETARRDLEFKLHAANLQLHDDQTLRDDYTELLKKHDEALNAIVHYKVAVQRDEETIAHLKTLVKAEPDKSETFKEVRNERDKYLKYLNAIRDYATTLPTMSDYDIMVRSELLRLVETGEHSK